MDGSGACLGLSFTDRQLYYAVNNPGQNNHLNHIGCIDFSFPLKDVISEPANGLFSGVQNTISNLGEKYSCQTVRILSPANNECWSIFPRLVHETPDEREDHLALLMDETPRDQLETTWFHLSNQDFRLLLVRKKKIYYEFRKLLAGFSESDLVSEFEIGSEWHNLNGSKGSFLTVNCHTDYLSVSSYLFGKLRGATYILYDNMNDLPYYWALYGSELTWMRGVHEQVYVYGQKALDVFEIMSSFFEETGKSILLNSLEMMSVQAEEKTYGFPLESAFPAILLSLNCEKA